MSLPTKAVILARGLGTRMRRESPDARLGAEQADVASTGVKAMIPIGRPFLDYALSALADAGLRDVCLVIGPEHDVVRRHYASTPLSRVTVTFAEQAEPLGTADAVLAAESFVGGDRFVVLNSDNYYPAAALARLRAAPGSAVAGFDRETLVRESNIDAARIGAFAVIGVDGSGRLTEVIEKPDAVTLERFGPAAPVSMNAWLFTPAIFEACRRTTPSSRGELEITDAVRLAMAQLGERFDVVPVREGVLDLSSRGDIASVQQRLADVPVVL
jgi:glucose-1-phosphate thymidylyltransferase